MWSGYKNHSVISFQKAIFLFFNCEIIEIRFSVQKVSELTAPLPPSYKSTKKDPSCPKNSDTRKSGTQYAL